MRAIPSDLQARLDSGATTLCRAYVVRRRDGIVQGFTDHDEDVVVTGVTCLAGTGFSGSEIAEQLGLAVQGAEISGALDADALSEADLAAGRYDAATVEAFLVDWSEPSLCVLMTKGVLGEVRREGSAFTAEPRAAIEPLALAYAFDAAEVDGQLAFRPRGGEVVADLVEDDLILPASLAPARLVRAQETELPREVSLSFTDAALDYQRSAVTSRRLVGAAARASQATLAVVTSDAGAERRADIWLQDLWAARETAQFELPPSRLALAPGDVIGITIAGRRRLVELRSIADADTRAVKAQSIDPGVFDVPLALPRRVVPKLPAAIGPAQALLLDLPTLTADEPPILLRVAVFADPWPGPMAIWRSFDGASFDHIATAFAPAIVGETLDDLPAGPTSRWDLANSVRVRLASGALGSASDTRVLNGANAAAVQRSDGAWEVVQFATADLVASKTYRLSRLLRGQGGSEWAMNDPLPAGAPFVLLDAHVVTLAQGLDMLGRAMQLRVVAADRDHGDPSAVSLTATVQATALKPLAPVLPRAVRLGDGVHLSWLRRKRLPRPITWSVPMPLGEESEGYEIEILSGSTVLRTLSSSTPSALYASADETADFGAPQASLSVRIYQRSAAAGRGFPVSATLAPETP